MRCPFRRSPEFAASPGGGVGSLAEAAGGALVRLSRRHGDSLCGIRGEEANEGGRIPVDKGEELLGDLGALRCVFSSRRLGVMVPKRSVTSTVELLVLDGCWNG